MLLRDFMENQAETIEKISFTCYGYKFSEEAFLDNSEEAEDDMEISFENLMYRIVIDGWIRDKAVITKTRQDDDILFVECKVDLESEE